jgi:predicted ester cyclase
MSEQNKRLTRRFYEEVFNKKNLHVIDELCAPGFVDHSAFPGQRPGSAGLKDVFGDYFNAFPDMSLTTHEMIAEGDIVVTRFTGHGTHSGPLFGSAPTGKKVSFTGMDMIRIKDGKATEVWHEGNDVAVFIELGIQPPA